LTCIAALFFSTPAVWCQTLGPQRPFYAEQTEIWYPDDNGHQDLIRITRLANRGFLAIHPSHGHNDMGHTGFSFYYLSDTEKRVQYNGDTDLGVAWLEHLDSDAIPGHDPMVDQYGDCSVLTDPAVVKTAAGSLASFPVLRIQTQQENETHTKWIAPDLGCFPLRYEVVEDDVVQKLIETVKVQLRPADTKLELPPGTRLISPQAYCDLYRERYGAEYLPPRLCKKYQQIYESVTQAADR
jgi:hypothetical protein